MNNDFACFILSHGRANNVKTLSTLKTVGYTGKIYIIIDNKDESANEYYKKYGKSVITFDKLNISNRFDTADTFDDMRTIVYARNACFDIAENLNLKYFLELDDDYCDLEYRYIKGNKLMTIQVKNADQVFQRMINLLEDTNALTVAFAQGGDFIGGADSKNYAKGIMRKTMNTFFCKTSNRFWFVGRINEDVNTYVTLGMRGKLLLSTSRCNIVQTTTQKNKGGMSDVYLDTGTYLKSFYTVMMAPSCVTIREMGDNHKRLHHHIRWDNCVPMILDESVKKR